jgi:HPt (histidine-containing phosphotransfer) domain-containing protein
MNPPTDPTSPAGRLREQIGTLGEKFVKRTADQVIALQQQLRAFAQGDRSALPAIGAVAHQIHGSGAVFGFNSISEAGGVLELLSAQLDREITSAGVTADAQQLTRLSAAVEQLERAVNQEGLQGNSGGH